jgi:hypothetical protein
MHISASGMLTQGVAHTPRAMFTFPTVTCLSDGTLLATCRTGSTKDSDDERIEFYRSTNGGQSWGEPWQPWGTVEVGGVSGSLKLCYLTELAPGHLLAATMWVDRTSYPGQPLFNAETEGCLPMAILLADSHDGGLTWLAWRHIPMPEEIGPPSLTSPILKLADGSLAMSIETNKPYHDRSRWYQRVVFLHSHDGGQTWSAPTDVGRDRSGRIFNWDLRCGVAPGGQVVTFAWTYDTETTKYLNIHRRISSDHGHTWSAPEDLGFTDQAGRPAMLADGRLVLPWVDRFHTHSIRARLALHPAALFDAAGEVILYTHGQSAHRDDSTGDLLAEMALWTFGLPYAEALPDGGVLVVYYAGNDQTLDVHWARLEI